MWRNERGKCTRKERQRKKWDREIYLQVARERRGRSEDGGARERKRGEREREREWLGRYVTCAVPLVGNLPDALFGPVRKAWESRLITYIPSLASLLPPPSRDMFHVWLVVPFSPHPASASTFSSPRNNSPRRVAERARREKREGEREMRERRERDRN